MKKIIALILILNFQLSILNSFSQPAIQWQKSFGGTYEDIPYSIVQTSDGGFIIAGTSNSIDGNVLNSGFHGIAGSAPDYWVVKTDNIGNIQWQHCYGGTYSEEVYSIIQTTDGGYIMAGNTESTDGDVTGGGNHGGIGDAWIVKINDTGAIEWQKCYGGSGGDGADCIKQTSDGGYIIAGGTNSNDGDVNGNHGNYDVWVFKIDAIGNLTWSKCFGGTFNEGAWYIIQTLDGGYATICTTNSTDGQVTNNHGSTDAWLIKIDNLGNLQWEHCYGGSYEDGAGSIIQTSSNEYILAGTSNSMDGDVTGLHYDTSGNDAADVWIFKIDSSGNLLWNKCYGGTDDDESETIISSDNGNFVIGGYTVSINDDITFNHGGNDYWILKINVAGILLWQKCYGGSYDELLPFPQTIVHTTDNGYCMAGYSSSNNGDVSGHHGAISTYTDFWVVKLAPDSTVGMEEINMNDGVSVYPNPVASTLNIRTPLGIRNYELGITDVMGNTVYHQTINKPNTQVDVSGFSNGVYFYRVNNERETQWGKFVVER